MKVYHPQACLHIPVTGSSCICIMLVSPRVPMNAIYSLSISEELVPFKTFRSIVYIIMLAWYGPMEGYFSVVQPNLDRFGIVSCRVFTLATISSSAHGKSQEVVEPGTCVQTRSPTHISSTLPRSFSPYNGVWTRNSFHLQTFKTVDTSHVSVGCPPRFVSSQPSIHRGAYSLGM